MWNAGDLIVRREVLNDGRSWLEVPVRVVRDDGDVLATYIPAGAAFTFPRGDWPGGGLHPWHGRGAWQGHGVLMLQRPDEGYAIWVFWFGPGREFRGWYVNFQEPFRRRPGGYDTQDLELDIWAPRDGPWEWKDDDVLEQRIAEGRLTREQVEATWELGRRVGALLDAGERWWDEGWAAWRPPDGWDAS